MTDEQWPPGHDPTKTGVFCTACNRSVWLSEVDEAGRCNLHQQQQPAEAQEGTA